MSRPAIGRDAVVAETLAWLGTPYRHQASLKGVGADCLGLVRGVFRALFGAEPEPVPAYTPDWADLDGGARLLAAARRHLTEIPSAAARPGEVLLFRWRNGLPARHAGILVAPDRFVHAHQGAAVAGAAYSAWWRRRTAHAFRFPGIVD